MDSYTGRLRKRSRLPTTRSSKRSLVKRIRGLSRSIRRKDRDEFTKFTLHVYRPNPLMSWAPSYITGGGGTSSGYATTAVARPADAYNDLVSDTQYAALLADYENYAISRIRLTYIPHDSSTGQRNEHGGIIAMGYDARGPNQVAVSAFYNLDSIGRLKYSKVVPMRGQSVSMAFSIRRLCKEFSVPFWLKAGSSPAAYNNDLGYLCMHYFKGGANASSTEGNGYFAGYLKVSYTVYLKNRLARN